MPPANVITGLGLITPLGVGVDATWDALMGGQFVTDVGRVGVERVAGVSRVAQLGLLAAREAIRLRKTTDLALLVGTSKGAADEWLADPTSAIGLSSLADDLSRELRLDTGPRFTFSAACASGLHALARATMLLNRGDATRCLVVASESSLHPLWHGTFTNLGVLARPGQPGRPFDRDRRGFVISEASAALVIERREPCGGDLVIEAAHIAADATHITGGDAEGKSLSHLITRLADDRRDLISFVHAHATGTASDAIETRALRDVFGHPDDENYALSFGPRVYSHKGSLGHTLGASGLVATVLSARIHATKTLPPMPTTRCTGEPGVHIPLTPVRPYDRLPSSLVLSAGFGGALAGIRLHSIEAPLVSEPGSHCPIEPRSLA